MDSHLSIGDAASYLVTGFLVVMGTLLALAVVCSFVGFFFKKFPNLAGRQEAAEGKKPQRKALPADAIDPTLLSVIGAAVDQSLGGRYRIKTVASVGRK